MMQKHGITLNESDIIIYVLNYTFSSNQKTLIITQPK